MEDHIESHPVENRKRVLNLSDIDKDANSRRSNLSSEWHEHSNSVDIPNKKGYSISDRRYNDLKDSINENFEDSSHELSIEMSSSYNGNEAKIGGSKNELFQDVVTSNTKTSGVSNTFSSSNKSLHGTMSDRFFKLMGTEPNDDSHPATSIHQLLHHHLACNENVKVVEIADPILKKHLTGEDLPASSMEESFFELKYTDLNTFQCILGAATSIAAKVGEDSLTYLNQGQSYEMKIKKLGNITKCQGYFYRTKVRFCFHERRLQYMEKEQLANWKQMRPGERIIEIDIPLSYGISNVNHDSKLLNSCEFEWEPAKEVSVYIKINCISTEFTHKKHGGEKGVPFRLQVETYLHTENDYEKVHSCASQIKVFKLKGADRKHKQDREKMMKRSHEINKYQHQCECTIFKELPLENLQASNSEEETAMTNTSVYANKIVKNSPSHIISNNATMKCSKFEILEDSLICKIDYCGKIVKLLDSSSSVEETRMWLISNRFSHLTSMFDNFGGTDILRLSKSELIEICGLVDGIRLYNALYFRSIYPRLTLHVSIKNDQVPIYNTMYLEKMNLTELTDKLAKLMVISPNCIHQLYLLGPSNINILVTDEVIKNFKDETSFLVDVIQKVGDEKYCLLLQAKCGSNTGANFLF